MDRSMYISFIDAAIKGQTNKKYIDALEESIAEPDEFWLDLLKEHGALMSQFPDYYNFYDNCLTEERSKSDAVAFRYLDESLEWEELSYRQLYDKSTALAQYWKHNGVEEGKKVLILLPFGVEYIIHLMAALKLGLTFSLYPLDAHSVLKQVCTHFSPECILTKKEYSYDLDDFTVVLTPDHLRRADIYEPSSYYKSDAAVCHVFDPLPDAPDDGFQLKAQYLFLQLIRDGYFYLDLNSHTNVLTTSGNEVLEQPVMILMTLLSGATFSFISQAALTLEVHPALSEFDADVILMTPELRDLFVEEEFVMKRCRLWVTNLRDEYDPSKYLEFFDWQKKNKSVPGAWFYAAGTGGALIYGSKNKDMLSTYFQPVPGMPTAYENPFISGTGAATSMVALSHTDPGYGTDQLPRLVLNKQSKRYYYQCVYPQHHRNISYPVEKIEEFLCENYPQVDLVLIEIENSWLGHAAYVVLTFERVGSGSLKIDATELIARVEQSFGPLFPIHRVEQYPFEATRDEKGEIDSDSLNSDYVLGVLGRKRTMQFFSKLHELKNRIMVYRKSGVTNEV